MKTLDAMYAQKMFTNGLATAQYDELHSYEDGLNVLGQAMMLDFGSPKQLERAMVTFATAGVADRHQLRGPAPGSVVVFQRREDGRGRRVGLGEVAFVHGLSSRAVTGALQRHAATRKMVEEIADGFLAHRHPDADGKYHMHYTVNFHTNEDLPGSQEPAFILWAAYRWTGDKKYLAPFDDDPLGSLRSINSDALDILKVRDTWGKKVAATGAPDRRDDAGNTRETNLQFAWQLTGDTDYLRPGL